MNILNKAVVVSFIVLAATLATFGADEPQPPGLNRSLVVANQGYFPVALRLRDGRIAVVLRGGAGHVGLKGRLDMVFSSDEGQTWTKPVVVVDTPVDDRNPALGQALDGTLVLAYWQYANFDEEGRPYRQVQPDKVTTWVTRSMDGGKTWAKSTPIDVADISWGSPFGKMLTLSDGTMLMAIYGGPVRTEDAGAANTRQVGHIYRSTDAGKTWKRLSTLGPRCAEPALARLPSGKLLAAVRTGDSGGIALTESSDNGQTWSPPKKLTPSEVHPADLLVLPDGRVLLTAGYRVGPYGACVLIGDKDGSFDWERRFVLVNDLIGRDCGFPSSVLLKDGRVLTVYYGSRSKDHPEWGVHCGAITYQVPAMP